MGACGKDHAETSTVAAAFDLIIADQAERLKGIGITGPDDLARKFMLLCNLYETICHADGKLEDEDGEMLRLTSDEARAFADKVITIMYGAPWRL